jgi:carboxyl-terminal processing protease
MFRTRFLLPIITTLLIGGSGASSIVRADDANKTATDNSQTNFDLRTTPEDCQKILSKVDQLISKELYSAEISKNEWPKAKAEFSKKILESKTLMELDTGINAAIKKLHSSHCQFVTINDETYFFLYALFSRFNHKLKALKMDFTGIIYGGAGLPSNQVRYIVSGSPGEQAKFQVGDKIATVSGEPFVGEANFFKTSGKKLAVVVERDGKRVDLTVVPVFKDPYKAYVEGTAKSVRITETPEGKVGYVHLWAGGGEAHDTFEELLGNKLADTDGLILDLRDGYGGNSLDDLDFFYRNPAGYPVFTTKDRSGKKCGGKEYYDKPVVALINGGSRSGKELLAFSLKQSGRAKLVGDRTAGYVLAGRLFPIDDRTALYLAVSDGEVGGVRLEGIGVEPDVSIPNPGYTIEVATEQLEKAKALLSPLLKKPLSAATNTK